MIVIVRIVVLMAAPFFFGLGLDLQHRPGERAAIHHEQPAWVE